MLKDWLVRRRENPYPSREEKKSLAQKTGLTYIQVRYLLLSCLNLRIKHTIFASIFFFRFAIGLRIGDESLKMLVKNRKRTPGAI